MARKKATTGKTRGTKAEVKGNDAPVKGDMPEGMKKVGKSRGGKMC